MEQNPKEIVLILGRSRNITLHIGRCSGLQGGGGYGSWSLKFKYGSVEVYGRAQDVPVATKMDPMCIDHHLVQSSPTKINVV
jgi:hypothetical protein